MLNQAVGKKWAKIGFSDINNLEGDAPGYTSMTESKKLSKLLLGYGVHSLDIQQSSFAFVNKKKWSSCITYFDIAGPTEVLKHV